MNRDMSFISVELTSQEREMAKLIAKQRNDKAELAGADPQKYGNRLDNLTLHYQGCCSEMAVAKGLNCYWTGSVTSWHNDGDAGGYQVRTARYEGGSLLVRPHEKYEDDPWVLAVNPVPFKAKMDLSKWKIIGWLYGREARKDKWFKNPNGRGGAYFVPQTELHDIESLPKMMIDGALLHKSSLHNDKMDKFDIFGE